MKYTKPAATSQRLHGLMQVPSLVFCKCDDINSKECIELCQD